MRMRLRAGAATAVTLVLCMFWRASASSSEWTNNDVSNNIDSNRLRESNNYVTPQEWSYLSNAFLKCKIWQVEETTDAINCPYHYYCNTEYAGNYWVIADWGAVLLGASSCLLLAGVMMWEMRGRLFGQEFIARRGRHWVPSGPILFPLSLVVLAKGERMNSVFPLSYMAPAWLQLLHISALGSVGYEIEGVSRNLNAVVYEVSMAVGMLHASLYVDAFTLPYYTGVEAFMSSSLSGICRSCICRKVPLVAGGTFFYRAWSYGSFLVVSALLSRLAYGLWWNHKRGHVLNLGRWVVELLAWGITFWEVGGMIGHTPPAQQGLPYIFVVALLAFLLLLVFSKRMWNLYMALNAKDIN